MASKDWGALRDLIEQALKENIEGLIDSSVADLDGPIRDTANRLVVAIRRGEAGKPLVAEIQDQLLIALLEKQIQVKQKFNNVFDVIIGMAMNLLFAGAVGGLSSLTTKLSK